MHHKTIKVAFPKDRFSCYMDIFLMKIDYILTQGLLTQIQLLQRIQKYACFKTLLREMQQYFMFSLKLQSRGSVDFLNTKLNRQDTSASNHPLTQKKCRYS